MPGEENISQAFFRQLKWLPDLKGLRQVIRVFFDMLKGVFVSIEFQKKCPNFVI